MLRSKLPDAFTLFHVHKTSPLMLQGTDSFFVVLSIGALLRATLFFITRVNLTLAAGFLRKLGN